MNYIRQNFIAMRSISCIIKSITPILLLLFVTTFNCIASDTTNAYAYRAKVKAVLVQLKSERNRIKAMTEGHWTKKLEEVRIDSAGERKAIIADFTENFNYCPVYYFMDTDTKKIIDKQFDGILMNADGSPAQNIVIATTDTNYLIVFFGYPVNQSNKTRVVTDSSKYITNPDPPYGIGLVINNHNLQQLAYRYYLKFDEHLIKKFRQDLLKYCYFSKYFDISYFATAESLQELLTNHNIYWKRHKHLKALPDRN